MTTKDEIREWFQRGLNNEDKPTHMMVVCDTYDWEDYPVYVLPEEDAETIYKKYNGNNMQKVMEVYNLSTDMESQMNEFRAKNF